MNDLSHQSDERLERGLLDLSVALSTRDITAGKQFTIFVLIRNPFNEQAWIRQVDVSLPSELKIAEIGQNSYEVNTESQRTNEVTSVDAINHLREELSNIKKIIASSASTSIESDKEISQIKDYLTGIEEKIYSLLNQEQANSSATLVLNKGSFGDVKVFSKKTTIVVGEEAKSSEDVSLGDLEVYDPLLIEEKQSKSGRISLSGSLPENNALQSGCTTVYTAVLAVSRPFLFTPSQYRLQFNVQYSFEPKPNVAQGEDKRKDRIFSNTVSHEISIRPSVGSMIVGGGFGGAVGSVSRVLQVNPADEIQQFEGADYYTSGISVLLAVILSCIAIIFMARKSDAQSFISVEDFWGGLLIGFLVGYTGTSFFQQLTGFSPDIEEIPESSLTAPADSSQE